MPIDRALITAASGTTSATVPTHVVGDLIVAFAFRDGSATAPSLPGSQNWSSPPNATRAGTSCSHRTAYKVATTTSETTGTFTNATSFIVLVIPRAHRTSPIGLNAVNSGSSTSINFPAVTPGVLDGSSFVLGFCGHRSTNVTIETAPSGMTNITSVSDATDEAAAHITTNGVTSWSSTNAAVGGTSSGWTSHTLVINSAQNMEAGPGLQDLSNAIVQIEAGLQSLKRGYAAIAGGGGGGGSYWNPADKGPNVTLSDSNKVAGTTVDFESIRSVASHSSGKWYLEFVLLLDNSDGIVGLAPSTMDLETGYPGGSGSVGVQWDGTNIYLGVNDTFDDLVYAVAVNDVLSVAYDFDAERFYFAINGTYIESADPAAGTGGIDTSSIAGPALFGGAMLIVSGQIRIRTQDADFTYSPPSGFTAWG